MIYKKYGGIGKIVSSLSPHKPSFTLCKHFYQYLNVLEKGKCFLELAVQCFVISTLEHHLQV